MGGGVALRDNPGRIEHLFRVATMLNYGLEGLIAASEGECLGRDDLWPFWELSSELLVALRELNEDHRAEWRQSCGPREVER